MIDIHCLLAQLNRAAQLETEFLAGAENVTLSPGPYFGLIGWCSHAVTSPATGPEPNRADPNPPGSETILVPPWFGQSGEHSAPGPGTEILKKNVRILHQICNVLAYNRF